MQCTEQHTKEKYAVKIVSVTHDTSNEIEALKLCHNHRNIVQLSNVVHDDKFTYIVMEQLNGPELFEYVKNHRLSENDARPLFADVLRAVQFMHSRNIVHRDLKLENVMFADKNASTLKVIDFGFACVNNTKAMMSTKCFTLEYAAPEVVTGKKYTESCDLWSLGVILYAMLCRHTPFRRVDEKFDQVKIKERIRRALIDTECSEWRSLSKAAKDLIKSLLTVNPTQRAKLPSVVSSAWFDNMENGQTNVYDLCESSDEQKSNESTSDIVIKEQDDDVDHDVPGTIITTIQESVEIFENGEENCSNSNDSIKQEAQNDTSDLTEQTKSIAQSSVTLNTIVDDGMNRLAHALENTVELTANDGEILSESEEFHGFERNETDTQYKVLKLLNLEVLLQYKTNDEFMKMLPVKPKRSVGGKGEAKKRKTMRRGSHSDIESDNDDDDDWCKTQKSKRKKNNSTNSDNIGTINVSKRIPRSKRRQEIQ